MKSLLRGAPRPGLSIKLLIFIKPLINLCNKLRSVFLKLRYRKIVAFRTKNWMDENLAIDSLQTSRFHILSDHFQCPYDAINTSRAKFQHNYFFRVFAIFVSTRIPSVWGGRKVVLVFEMIYLFFRPSSYFLWSNDFDNQQHFVSNSLWSIACLWWAGIF